MKLLKDLSLYITMANIKGDIRHPNSYAMGQVPIGYSRWAAASNYLSDIERIILELDTAKSLVEKLPDEEFLKLHSINIENYIMYHQGYFLDLMHQLKDKLVCLIYSLIAVDGSYSTKKLENMKVGKLLNQKLIKNIPSITILINVWNADLPQDKNIEPNPITIALKKRTNYHHYKNPLTMDKNFFQLKTNRFLLSPEFSSSLSDYGKELISEKGKQSLSAWHGDCLSKMTNTLDSAKENINNILLNILTYFKFSGVDDFNKKIAQRYIPLMQDIVIPKCDKNIDNLKPVFRDLFKLICLSIKTNFNSEFISMYAIGSAIRDSFVMGISDINIVLIIKSNNQEIKDEIKKLVLNPPIPLKLPINIEILSIDEFKSLDCEKYRFICQTDGILVEGEHLLKNEKEYNKSYNTVWLLNKDYKNEILKFKEFVSNNKILSKEICEEIARDVVKRSFRLSFGMTMGNNAVYAVDYKDMLNLMNFYNPDNAHLNKYNYKLISNRIMVNRDDLYSLICNYEIKFNILYDAIKKAIIA